MAPIKSQNSNMLLAFLTLLGVIAIVAVVGFFMAAYHFISQYETKAPHQPIPTHFPTTYFK